MPAQRSFFASFFILLPFALFAQSDGLAAREEALKSLSGTAFATEALDLSGAWYLERSFDKAISLAQMAYAEAEKASSRELMARALSMESKAMLASPKLRPADRSRVVKKLLESNALNPDDPLRMENLKMLKQLYYLMGKAKEQREAEREIAQLIVQKNQNLESALAEESSERARMEGLQQNLTQTLQEREEAIASMSESQAKTQLLLAQQKSILDSLSFLKMVDSLKLAQQDMEIRGQEAVLQQQQAQLGLQKAQRNLLLVLVVSSVVFLLGLFSRYAAIKRYNREIAEEKKRSDELLLNILPEKVANELKANGKAKAQFFEQASVLFVDFAGFSQFAAHLAPDELVATLDYCFQEFDHIIGRHGLEKIKTIGDAYMAAGGLPSPDPANPKHVVQAAIDIKEFLDNWRGAREKEGKPWLNARIGIHTGPLVAGVVGERKFAYDIWGDTVNVASRMESSGESGKINISATTYEQIKESFECRHRGKIPTRNLGDMDMYFVEKEIGNGNI
jgi:class 3 adenylate cyclase